MTSQSNAGPILVAAADRGAEPVLRTAAWLASFLARRVKLVSVLHTAPVIHWAGAPPEISVETDVERAQALRGLLDGTLRRIFGRHPDWQVDVVRGDPARLIASAARECGASLIVMGLGRHRPIDRLLGAETTLATVRTAEAPVLALCGEMHRPPEKVVIATDFSATCANAVRQVLPLLSPHATLVFAHVWQSSQMEAEFANDDEYRRQLPARFCRFIATLQLPTSITVRQEILEGSTAERVLDLADIVMADLIVAGRHGRGALERLLVGSVATRLLRGSTRSVFLTPETSVAQVRPSLGVNDDSFVTADPDEWPALLADFTARNERRQTRLSVSDTVSGTSSEDRGYRLVRISYEQEDPVVEIVLGEPNGPRQVRRVIADVSSLTLITDDEGNQRSLHIAHGSAETVVGFLPEHSRMEVAV